MNETPVLECNGISVAFGGNQALTDVSIRVQPGFHGLVGPNGAGKTTLFNVISAYVRSTAGEVLLQGKNIIGARPAAVARHGVARTFQTPKLVQDMTVLENVQLGLDGRKGWRNSAAHFGLPHAEREDRLKVGEVLAQLGLDEWSGRLVSSVPLGLQKQVEIARALVSRPCLLLLDEPAAGVSASDVSRIVEPLKDYVTSHKLAIVIIEHDLDLVTRLCPTMTVLNFGRVLVTGAPDVVVSVPEVVDAYLGAGHAAGTG